MHALPVLRIKKGREKSVNQRHPWIFSGAVAAFPAGAAEGDMVEIHSAEGTPLAVGFLSLKSQISGRLFDFWPENAPQVHTMEYWRAKIANAYALRRRLILNEWTDSCRLIHAEGDEMPGLIIDKYGPVLVLQVLTLGIERLLPQITEALTSLGFPNLYVKAKTSAHRMEDTLAEARWLAGESISPIAIKENGLNFLVDYIGGQKTGFFLDQRDNRRLLSELCYQRRVLNTFSFSGGFSLYALQGGAERVESVDISAAAIDLCERNVAMNFDPATAGRHTGTVADCFDYLKDLTPGAFDLIVLDPPAFAKSARAVKNAARGYKQINLQAMRKLPPGGLLFTFSCSQNIDPLLFRKIVFGAAADARRHARILYQLHQPADHPINIYHPESEYLKGLVVQVD